MLNPFITLVLIITPLIIFSQEPSKSLTQEVDSLLHSASKLSRSGNFEEALMLTNSAREKTVNQLGTHTISYADCQHQLGAISLDMKQFDKAEPLLLEGLQMRKQLLGSQHKAISTSLNSLGILYAQMMRSEDSERCFREALDINKVVFGPRHFNYAMGIQNMAMVFKNSARYEEAEALLREAISILKDTIGEAHPLVAMSAMNLGLSQMKQGAYDDAEKVLTKSLAICKGALPANHPYIMVVSNSLATLFMSTGRYKEAISMIDEAKQICRAIYGEDSALESDYCATAGLSYKALMDFDNAEKELLRSVALAKKGYGENHPFHISFLANVGILYAAQEKYETALQYMQLVVEKYAETRQEGTPEYGIILLVLGRLHKNTGDMARAESRLSEASALFERLGCMQRYEYGYTLNDLGGTYSLQNNAPEAAAQYRKLVQWHRNYLITSARHLSEQDILSLKSEQESQFAQVFSFCYSQDQPALNGDLYDMALMTKHFLLEQKLRVRKAINKSDSTTLAVYHKWLGTQRNLASEYTKAADSRAHVEQLEQAANQQERLLTQQLVGGFKPTQWKEVQAQLQPGEAALEFVHFPLRTPNATDSVVYAALLLRPGMESPLYIPLFEERAIKALLPPASKNRSEYVNQLYQNEALSRLIWQPLAPRLEGINTVYWTPAGLLHRIQLSALTNSDRSVLSDKLNFVALGSTRQIAEQGFRSRENRSAGSDAALYGAILYDAGPTTEVAKPAADEFGDGKRGWDFSQVEPAMREGNWGYLRHSERELNNVARILEQSDIAAQTIKGHAATEESIKAYGTKNTSPTLLHISTHGYFFPDPELALPSVEEKTAFISSQHPLIRAGLIMAGANQAWTSGHSLQGREDGILTAYEISQLDLSETELVVLSACETGLGDIVGNEGVYGLQRAFRMAGVSHVLMSLWKVSDLHTQELMTLFYQKWLEEKLPLHQALTAAQKAMRDKGYEPYHWAGWVLVE